MRAEKFLMGLLKKNPEVGPKNYILEILEVDIFTV
jgi:hypothetical protein